MLELLKKIEAHGYKAYYVGGYPRDLYLGFKTDDYDLITDAKPFQIKEILDVNLEFSPFGNTKFSYKGNEVEITTFRKDLSYSNYRFPKVEYISTLEEDLQRRDFIINTLCIDSSGDYLDLLNAKADIDNKIVRTVGDADNKIKEDAIRILRAIRFAVRFNFSLDYDLEQSIIKYKNNLRYISDKRKQREIKKILEYKNGEAMLKKFGII